MTFDMKLARQLFDKYNLKESYSDYEEEDDYYWEGYYVNDSDYEIVGVSDGFYYFTLEGDEMSADEFSEATGIPADELELIGQLIQHWAENEYKDDIRGE